MGRAAAIVLRLGIKELYSVARDPVLVILIAYTFTFAIQSVASGVQTEVRNAAIAIVDEDRSALSQRIRGAFLRPYFQPAEVIGLDALDRAMDTGAYSFVLDIPPGFQADILAGRRPALQLNVDATAMTLAGNGAAYIQTIVNAEIQAFLRRGDGAEPPPVALVTRARFNPNLDASWYFAGMELVNNITIIAMILAGAAVIREREHGTIEHLLVMPITPGEIMAAKVWANGLIIVAAAVLSLHAVVQGWLGVPVAGSVGLFAFGTAIYLFSITSLGIMLATIATSMPQFGLLAIPVFVVMNLLSGGATPLEAMPETLQLVMQASPATHFIKFAQAVLYRGADLSIVWPRLAAVAGIGLVFFLYALARFRATMAAVR